MCITLKLWRKSTKKNWEKSPCKNIQYMYVSERGDREDRVLCRKLRRLLPKGISWVFAGKIYDSFISFLFSCTSLLISVHFSVDTIYRTYDTIQDLMVQFMWAGYDIKSMHAWTCIIVECTMQIMMCSQPIHSRRNIFVCIFLKVWFV